MKFKRGVNVFVRFGEWVTVPSDEIWSVRILGGYMGTDESISGKVYFYSDDTSYKNSPAGKYTLPGGVKLKACQEVNGSKYDSLLVGIALTAD